MVQWCWINFLCWGDLLNWIKVGHGSTVLVVGASGCLDIFFVFHFSLLSRFLWETARYTVELALTPSGPWKYIRDRGSSSQIAK